MGSSVCPKCDNIYDNDGECLHCQDTEHDEVVFYAVCQNCSKRWREDALKEIKHFWQRVNPGEICPAGECPDCGAVCHRIIESTTTPGGTD